MTCTHAGRGRCLGLVTARGTAASRPLPYCAKHWQAKTKSLTPRTAVGKSLKSC